MKILFCIHSCSPETGGTAEFLRLVPEVLQSWGHEPELLSLDTPGESWLDDYPIPVHALGPGFPGHGYTSKLVPWLRKHRRRFDVFIVNGLWQYTGMAVRKALKESDIPYFVYPHGMLNPWAKRNYPFKHLKKWIYWHLAEYCILRDARAVFFTCMEERNLARQVFRRYQCNEVVVNLGSAAPTGDPVQQREAFLGKFPHLSGKKIILFLGRVDEKKGLDLLFKAYARLLAEENSSQRQDIHLVIAGPCHDVSYLDELKEIERRMFPPSMPSGSRITWTGMLNGDFKWGAFWAADAFILPSHQENFGIAVAEALSTGTPVLISDKVNIWREIKDDAAGFIDDDTLEGCLSLLKRYLSAQGIEFEAMRENALSCFQQRFEVHKAAESLLKAVQEGMAIKVSS